MAVSRQTWWRVFKVVLTLLVLVCVGWQFARLLSAPELWRAEIRLRWRWSVGAGLLYLLGLGCSALYWYCLMRVLGERPHPLGIVRAYYVGQLGRYVPGKVAGVILRTQLLNDAGISRRLAVLTIIYETLTTLSAGALLAVLLLPAREADLASRRWQALGLLLLLGIPLLPTFFNRLARQRTSSLPEAQALPVPRLKSTTLALGLLITSCGWALQGLSLWALLQALLPEPQPWHWQSLASDIGIIALATAVGFLIVTVPGGLGVRELIVQQYLAVDLTPLLGAEQALAMSVVAALLLRLVWIIAEVSAAGILYWVRPRAPVPLAPLTEQPMSRERSASAC